MQINFWRNLRFKKNICRVASSFPCPYDANDFYANIPHEIELPKKIVKTKYDKTVITNPILEPGEVILQKTTYIRRITIRTYTSLFMTDLNEKDLGKFWAEI